MTLELVMWCYNHKNVVGKCTLLLKTHELKQVEHASNALRYEFHYQKMCELKNVYLDFNVSCFV